MIDISLGWDGDLAVGPTGDLAVAIDIDTTNQRICRRLLTNAGDYIWELDYGGSLGRFVGRPAATSEIEAVVRSQLLKEATVTGNPPPKVTTTLLDRISGIVNTTITYSNPSSASAVTVSVTTPTS